MTLEVSSIKYSNIIQELDISLSFLLDLILGGCEPKTEGIYDMDPENENNVKKRIKTNSELNHSQDIPEALFTFEFFRDMYQTNPFFSQQ